MKTLVTSLLLSLSVSVFANDKIDAKLDDLNTKINQLVSDVAKEDGTIVSVVVKKDEDYVRIFSSQPALVGKPVADIVHQHLDAQQVFKAKNYKIGDKTCESAHLKGYQNNTYFIGMATGCK